MTEESSSSSDLVSLILEATSIGSSTDTLFAKITNSESVRVYDRPPSLGNYLQRLLDIAAGNSDVHEALFVAMLDQGNFLDIACELRRQIEQGLNSPGYQFWQTLAVRIAALNDNMTFYLKRIYIMQQPFVDRGEPREVAIAQAKNSASLPQSCNWDAVSYKVPARGVEYMFMINSALIDKLTQVDISVIDQIQRKIKDTATRLFQQNREEEKRTEDEIVKDYTVFLESRIAGLNQEERSKSIANMGDLELIKYVTATVQAFTQGIIPGTIQPGKVSSCQDTISMVELQTSIQSLAESQVQQAGDIMANPNVRAGIKDLGRKQGGSLRDRWTEKQATSITTAASMTQQLMTGMSSFGEDPYQPQKEIGNQVSGGANTLFEQMNLVTQNQVVRLTPRDQEVLKQSLSLLIACLRIRFEATKNASAELVTQEDIDHLTVIDRLSRYVDPNSMHFFVETVQTLTEAMASGHNKTRLLNKGPSQKALDQTMTVIEAEAESLAKSVPLLAADLQEGRALFGQMLSHLYLALADEDRLDRERQERYIKRSATFNAVKFYQ